MEEEKAKPLFMKAFKKAAKVVTKKEDVNLESLNTLLEKDNLTQSDLNQALHWVVKRLENFRNRWEKEEVRINKYEKIIALLIAKGADINSGDKHGYTPLESAVYGQNSELVKLLVKYQTDINAVVDKETGATVLHIAATRESILVTKALIEEGRANVNATDAMGRTPLHAAVLQLAKVVGGGPETISVIHMIRLLLDQGAEQISDKEGKWPHELIPKIMRQSERDDLLQYFMKNMGELIEKKTEEAKSPSRYLGTLGKDVVQLVTGRLSKGEQHSLLKANKEISRYVSQAPKSFRQEAMDSKLRQAAHDGKKAEVESCLEKGAKVNARNLDTPLTAAVKGGNKEVVTLLISSGATIDFTNDDGDTALDIAARSGKKDIVELLLKSGAKIDVGRKDGKTALFLAVEAGKGDVVEPLVAAGAKVDASFKYAVEHQHERVIDALLKNHLDAFSRLTDKTLEKTIVKHFRDITKELNRLPDVRLIEDFVKAINADKNSPGSKAKHTAFLRLINNECRGLLPFINVSRENFLKRSLSVPNIKILQSPDEPSDSNARNPSTPRAPGKH
jgi:ankyrin repeat protein